MKNHLIWLNSAIIHRHSALDRAANPFLRVESLRISRGLSRPLSNRTAMIYRKIAIAGFTLMLMATGAYAKPGRDAPFPADYDANGDGMITQEEVQTGRALEFQGIDLDASGYLSVMEVQLWLEQQQGRQFDHLDIDHNGMLSKAEFVDARTGRALRIASKTFKLTDTNGDGLLGLSEYSVLKPVNLDVIRLFSIMDADDDDLISLPEFLAN